MSEKAKLKQIVDTQDLKYLVLLIHNKIPPAVKPRTHRLVRAGGQHSMYLPECVQQEGGGEASIVQSYTAETQEQNHLSVVQELRALVVSKNEDVIVQSKIVYTQNVMVSQKSWDEDVKNSMSTKPAEAAKLSNYKRSYSVPEKSLWKEETEKYEDLMAWWRTVEPWEDLPNTYLLIKGKEARAFTEKAHHMRKALCLYDYLLSERGQTLQNLINELLEEATDLDKVCKGTKIAGITGGTAGAVGVAAAVGGVILAPLTMGASLAVTAIGVGVAAAGGATGASAAIANKVKNNSHRKNVEKILQNYTTQMEDIENCVKFIGVGIEYLRKHDLSMLQGVDTASVRVARVAQVASTSSGAISAISKSSGLIQGFTLRMDIYFTKGDSQKLKKKFASKFAKQIRAVAEQMQASLNELMRVKTVLTSDI